MRYRLIVPGFKGVRPVVVLALYMEVSDGTDIITAMARSVRASKIKSVVAPADLDTCQLV